MIGKTMRRSWLMLVLGFTTTCLAIQSRAQAVLVSGNSFGGSNTTFTDALNTLGFSYTFVSSVDLGTTSLNGFSAVWLDGFSQYSPGTPGNPGLSAANLTSFMNSGGVVIVQNPGFGSEALPLYPFGNELTAEFNNSPGFDTIQLTAPLHPVNAGLTSSGLSNWGPSAYGRFTGSVGSFTGISDDGTAGEWITLYRAVGAGALIYTQQGLSQRIAATGDAQALQFLDNAVSLSTVPEPAVTGLLLASVAGVAGICLRRKKQESV
jgi:hypothetical protein